MHREVGEIRSKMATNPWPKYLSSITIDGLRGWTGQQIRFPFPITAICGENGTGKSTVLKAAACAYISPQGKQDSFYPLKFFPDTPWERVERATITYSLREVDRERNVYYKKAVNRWRHIGKRPERYVVIQDVSRTLPIEATVGYAYIAKRTAREISADVLSPEITQYYSSIMGRRYSSARTAISDVDAKRKVGVVQASEKQFSQFHQGAGEDSTFDLLSQLQTIPDTSLVLIDEIEASLHPRSQRRLVHFLLWLVRVKQLQAIVTTHSPFILDELPPDARILIERTPTGRDILYSITPSFAMNRMDDVNTPDLYIFTEDEQASRLTSVLLRQAGTEIRRLGFVEVGPANVVNALGSAMQRERFPLKGVGILDADQPESDYCVKMPGDEAPEKQVFKDVIRIALERLAARLDHNTASLQVVLEHTMTIMDHHEWPSHAASQIGCTSEFLWEAMCDIWVKYCLSDEKKRQFRQDIERKMV